MHCLCLYLHHTAFLVLLTIVELSVSYDCTQNNVHLHLGAAGQYRIRLDSIYRSPPVFTHQLRIQKSNLQGEPSKCHSFYNNLNIAKHNKDI